MQEYCKILIADDEYIMRQGIKHLLDWESEGFELVGEASNGREALELVEQVHPHIILTDVVMPQMDGIELTKYLRVKYPEIQAIMLSGYSDFDYVKNAFRQGAIDYILKPALNPEDLLDALRKAAAKIPNLTLKTSAEVQLSTEIVQLIKGEGNLERAQTHFPYNYFALLGISARYCKDDQVVKSFITSDIVNILPDFHPCPVEVDDETYMAILNCEPSRSVDLPKAAQEAVEKVAQVSPNMFAVLSDGFQNLSALREVYADHFQKLTERRFYSKGHSLMRVGQFPASKPGAPFNTKKYTKLISTLCFDEALQMLQDYVAQAVNEWQYEEDDLRALVENTTYNFILSLEDLKLNADSLAYLKINYLNRLENALYAEDFLEMFGNICDDFRVIVQNYQLELTQDVMNLIISYIQRHYSEPLTLAELAERFNFSYYYLSSYFSNKSDEGFSEYLNRVRIEKSLELLRNKRIPISEVSASVGYSDHSYFSKVFKKFTGLTPSEYRKGAKKGEQNQKLDA